MQIKPGRNFIGKSYQAEYLQLTFLLHPCYLLYAAPLSVLLIILHIVAGGRNDTLPAATFTTIYYIPTM